MKFPLSSTLSILGKLSVLLCFGVLLSACAVGNKYDYKNQAIDLKATSSQTVAVAVVDQRTYVTSGEKTPDFVGLYRGGFNNPFDVVTESGEPLSDDLAFSIASALGANNIDTKILKTTPTSKRADAKAALPLMENARTLIVYLLEYKSDQGYYTHVLYNVEAEVVDKDGTVLGTNKISDDRAQGPDFTGKTVQAALVGVMQELIGDPQIVNALQ